MHPAVTISHVTKSFGAVKAVKDVSFQVESGRVHALMGENGAGKSTLMKILAGVHRPNSGFIALDGERVQFANPKDALAKGVSTVFQELSLLPNLTIAENIFLGKEILNAFGVPDREKMAERAKAALEKLGIKLDPNTLVAELTIAERQFVEIAHGINADAKIFILDEPTAALNAADVDVLNAQIRALKVAGKAIIYISHRMDEIFEICDDVTVMKDGAHVATCSLSELDPDRLIALMVGRELTDLYPPRAAELGPPKLSCKQLCLAPNGDSIFFNLREGEILGIAGLEGQGQQAIMRSLVGQYQAESGELSIAGQKVSLPLNSETGLREMQRLGVGFVPEDRKDEGLLLGSGIGENIDISVQSMRPGYRLLAKLKSVIERVMIDLNVKAPSAQTPVGSLSGGNQQKVLLGRSLAAQLDVLIIEEPTRGVDIGAKSEIYKHLRSFTQAGKAILVLSRETVELIGLCDRILVVHDQRIVAEMPAEDATEHAILEVALKRDQSGG